MAGIGKRAAKGFSRVKDWLMEYAYLVTLGAAIAVVVAAAMYTDRVKAQQEASLQAAAQAMEVAATAVPEIRVTPLPTIAPLAIAQTTFKPRIVTVWPVSGKIVRAYEKEPVFWRALSVYQAHEAIDVAGNPDESVLCVMDGVVTQAVMDTLWGWRVCVAHTDGSEGLYAGLALSFVQAGQSVTRGQEIGTLLKEIPCEAELGAHLHLELSRDGIMQDPEGILPE